MKSLYLIPLGLALFLTANFAQSSELEKLAATERAFAKTSIDKGQREAFIEFFAEDGINFTPHPTLTRAALLKTPPTPQPQPFLLNWQPIFGDISAAGDLGFTTGPYIINVDNRPPRYGMFFSVWKKQADQNWKVVADFGVSTPQPVAPLNAEFLASQHPQYKGSKNDSPGLLKIDQEFFLSLKTEGAQKAYRETASRDARIYRPNSMPVVGADAIQKYFEKNIVSIIGTPIKAAVSNSDDLGYVYGNYEAGLEKGYYLRVWRRSNENKWQIVADIANILPSENSARQPIARPEDVASIDGIVKAFYEVISGPAGQARQWDRDRTLYIPSIRFIAMSVRNGKPRASILSHDDYVKAVNDAMVKEGFFETEIHRVTKRFGNIVQIFSTYESRKEQNGKVEERGINSLELYFDGTRWWISAVSWEGERADNPIPKEYLP